MSDVMDRPRTAPLKPPAARASAVLERRPAIERELADLKLQIGEAVLAAYEGGPGSRQKLIELDSNIRAVELQLSGNAAAHALALQLDGEAKASWRAAIEAADPDEMVAGIDKKRCSSRCSEAHGCVITGLQCGHPIKVGSVGPRLMANVKVRNLFRAASQKLGVYR